MSIIDTVLFDFGGVLAEKGFAGGLCAIAQRHGLNESLFYTLANEMIHKTGYLTGHADEHTFWQAIRDKTGITDDDNTLRNEIISRFILRPWMFDIVKKLKYYGIKVAILSDQTNWLDELNEKEGFFKYFNVVLNSYHIGKSKIDPSHFSDTISRLDSVPEKLLFIDDNEMHCKTAEKMGIKAIHFVDRDSFLKDMARFCLP
ncbi:MAG TPA: HAD family phosphatase [Syntrophorhabdaceae bacterium]|nr:HAD family phosphatase [Syntrophorhabdaceae bacterium]HOG39972.1 HAD family phosphatase [Syntrophorhabdaceae bacterium]